MTPIPPASPAANREGPEAVWDRFLEATPEGQFQQASGWAKVKARDGWSVERRLHGPEAAPIGGFQLLWKRSRLGRIGYVSKGPVVAADRPEAGPELVDRLIATAREIGLRALVVQPPDDTRLAPGELDRRGFLPYALPSVIRTTAVLPLADGPEAVARRMDRQARREWRVAEKRGVRFRWGGREDLSVFFEMMCESARRQQSSPNPARLDLLEALWDELAGRAFLGLAEHEGKIVAGLLLVGFGRRLNFWKKGWRSEDPKLFANCLLNAEALVWGAHGAYDFADFAAMAPEVAETLLAGKRLNDEQNRGRDRFNLRLGAGPRKLPPAQLLAPSAPIRALLRYATKLPPLRRALFARMGPA